MSDLSQVVDQDLFAPEEVFVRVPTHRNRHISGNQGTDGASVIDRTGTGENCMS